MGCPVSKPSALDSQFCHIVFPYSMTNIFDDSNINEIYGQKKRKFIIKSNDSIKKIKKSKTISLKKGSLRWNEKEIINC